MDNIRRILFAVKNPEGRKYAAIDKAIDIAKPAGRSLELFHAISTPLSSICSRLTGTSLSELKSEALRLQSQRLEAHAARARKLGVKVICKVIWDYPPHEASYDARGAVALISSSRNATKAADTSPGSCT
jgi:hypothetical protein